MASIHSNCYCMTHMPDKYKLLVVDDEEDICDILQFNLSKAGYIVETAASAEEALVKLKKGFHLLLLDIMMDGISGLKMAQLLREEYNNNIPIIFLSALDTEADILRGFDKGGDDYIPKPFSVKEVLARVNAILNRCHQSYEIKPVESESRRVFGELAVDALHKRVYIGSEEIILTKKECEILILFTEHCNQIFSREDILKKVWKDESYVLDRTVDVHIARLRKKLNSCGNMIVNRPGYGYCFQPHQ